MRAARPTISEIFGRAALASRAIFRVIYLSLWLHAWLLGATCRPGIAAFACVPPVRAQQLAQERYMKWKFRAGGFGPQEQKSAEISSHFFLFGCLRPLALGTKFRSFISLWLHARLVGGTCRPGTETPNLSEFTDWPRLSTGIYALL